MSKYRIYLKESVATWNFATGSYLGRSTRPIPAQLIEADSDVEAKELARKRAQALKESSTLVEDAWVDHIERIEQEERVVVLGREDGR